MARPSSFTPELGERICALIAEGMSLRKASEADGMPNWRTILRWLATKDAEPKEGEDGAAPFDAFRQQYARAREIRADARFERIDDVIDDMRAKKVDAQMARVEIDAIKWQAGKENGRRYGEAVTLRGDKNNPVEVRRTSRDLTDEELMARAQGGLRGVD